MMTSALTNFLAFIVAISVLVAVHEYGHYIVGRYLGVVGLTALAADNLDQPPSGHNALRKLGRGCANIL